MTEVGRHPWLLLQTSCSELILWREEQHQHSSILQEPSPITMTIQKYRMASCLSTCWCLPSVSMVLLKISLTWSSFTEGKHEFFQIFPFVWEARDLWMSALSVRTEAKQELSTSTILHGLGCQVPHTIQQKNIFLAFLLLLMPAQQLFFSPFTFLTRFNSQWSLALLTLSLHTHGLYIPCIICPCFHLLYASFCASVLSGGNCSTIWISYHLWLSPQQEASYLNLQEVILENPPVALDPSSLRSSLRTTLHGKLLGIELLLCPLHATCVSVHAL